MIPITSSTVSKTTTTINSASSPDVNSSFTGSYLFDTVLLLIMLFFVIEILDFAFYLHTNSPYDTTISSNSSNNLATTGDVAVSGAAEEEFELITAHSGNNNSGGNISSETGISKGSSGALSSAANNNLAASLSLNDFNSPVKVLHLPWCYLLQSSFIH